MDGSVRHIARSSVALVTRGTYTLMGGVRGSTRRFPRTHVTGVGRACGWKGHGQARVVLHFLRFRHHGSGSECLWPTGRVRISFGLDPFELFHRALNGSAKESFVAAIVIERSRAIDQG